MTPGVADRYRRVLDRVSAASARAGRSAEEITVVVVGKTFPADAIAAVAAAGARDVGESYVQEARAKQALLADRRLRWHLVGRLQRNKAAAAAALFDLVHSVDSLTLAAALDAAALKAGRILPCLIEVNLAAEPTKGGAAPEALPHLLESLSTFAGLSIRGLMGIPPALDDAEASRAHFRRLRALRDRLGDLRLANVQLKELSMGMSGDFEVAIEEGATLIRIGTAIFGVREPRP